MIKLKLSYLGSHYLLSFNTAILLYWILPIVIKQALGGWTEINSDYILQVRSIEIISFDSSNPKALTYSSDHDGLFIIDVPNLESQDGVTYIFMINHLEEISLSKKKTIAEIHSINVTYDALANRLFSLQPETNNLMEISVPNIGIITLTPQIIVTGEELGLDDPQGITIDPESKDIFILDNIGPRIIRIKRDQSTDLSGDLISEIIVQTSEPLRCRGLAYEPIKGHFHILSPNDLQLYEVAEDGMIVTRRDLSNLELMEPQGMTFAPSGDLSDSPSIMNLYIIDRGGAGQIRELATIEAPRQPCINQANLVQIIETSSFAQPSPDPAGLVYLDHSDSLLISDSEVNETEIFSGFNVYEMTRHGVLANAWSTTSFSLEPTGITINPSNNHLFITDDRKRSVFELDSGQDKIFSTPDDILTSFSTRSFPVQSNDPEGITYNILQGVLFVVDGTNSEVYQISPGKNGIFDGTPFKGDDQVIHFDTASIGVLDPEGIAFDPDHNSLYVVGQPATILAQFSTEGGLLRLIDISSANARKPAGLVYAPSSQNFSLMNLYIADRGFDNDSILNENDGKVYELSLPPITQGNMPPIVDPGSDQMVVLPDLVNLRGNVSDDRITSGPLMSLWSHISGPGTVTFADSGSPNTTASFSMSGTYVLRLDASDGELIAGEEITVIVTGSNGQLIRDFQISVSSDDAEERTSGSTTLNSSDLDMVISANSNQTVGLRFRKVSIPPKSTIVNAFVQFKSDEGNSEEASLTIYGEASDNASTFKSIAKNITSRTSTAASLKWTPAPWVFPGMMTPNERTSDLSSVIQEIVNRPGWSSGNSLALMISGTGKRIAESYDGNRKSAPLLHVEYLDSNKEIPLVTITAPTNGAVFSQSDTITFVGNASDPEDGDLTAKLVWTSNQDGSIGTSGGFTSSLSVGSHIISALAIDSEDNPGLAEVTVTIIPPGNAAPNVSIIAPENQSMPFIGGDVDFIATANDAEDGNLSSSLAWVSDIDGTIGSGENFSTNILSKGVHIITASVTDSGGLKGKSSITISIIDNSTGNLVGNPSFEADASGWQPYRESTLRRTTEAVDGRFSLRVTGPDERVPEFGVNDTPTWIEKSPAAGIRYRFTAWVKSNISTGAVFLRVREFAGRQLVGQKAESIRVNLSPSWQMITVDYLTQAAGTKVDLQILDAPVAERESFWVDNISIKIIP